MTEPIIAGGGGMYPLYPIGHFHHILDEFVALLERHVIDAVADVRSQPYSQLHPYFNMLFFFGVLGFRLDPSV